MTLKLHSDLLLDLLNVLINSDDTKQQFTKQVLRCHKKGMELNVISEMFKQLSVQITDIIDELENQKEIEISRMIQIHEKYYTYKELQNLAKPKNLKLISKKTLNALADKQIIELKLNANNHHIFTSKSLLVYFKTKRLDLQCLFD